MRPPPAVQRPLQASREQPGATTASQRWLDELAGSGSFAFGVQASPYLASGVVGVAAGFAMLCGLALVADLPLALAVTLSGAAMATFIGASLVRKAVLHQERHVLFEDVLLVLAAGGLMAWATKGPVLTSLDLLAPALGGFLIFGRIGCFRGGCCHGRPSPFGARASRGGPLGGLRLFPLQLVEAVWIAMVTAVSVAFVVGRAEPGTSVWWWLLAYGAGRFVLELGRGDAGRPMLGPLSEAQWTFLALVVGRIAYEGVTVPLSRPMLVASGAALAIVLPLGWWLRAWWLDLPRRGLTLAEMAGWQRFLEDLERDARLAGKAARAHGGFEVRLGVDPADGGQEMQAYALRRVGQALDEEVAVAIAGVFLQRLPEGVLLRAEFCEHGDFHVWACIDPRGTRRSTLDDPMFEVRLRAQAFARDLHGWVPAAPPAAPPAPDPDLLPPPEPAAAKAPAAAPAWSFADLRLRGD